MPQHYGAADRVQERTISHTGAELGEDHVELSQNQIDPQRPSTIAAFSCPRKYESIEYAGRRHFTKMILRSLEEFEGDGSAETFDLDTRLQPVGGEEDIEDQPFPIVVGYDVDDETELEIVDVDYATNEVTVDAAPDDGNDLKFWPVITQGAVQYQGVNQFDQVEGPIDKWSTPVYRWAFFDQDKRGTEVNLQGAIHFSRDETLELTLDSPAQVVWDDVDYPRGEYVSQIEQRVDIEL